MQIKGHNGQIEFDGSDIIISRKGALAFLTQGLKGEKTINVESVSAVQFKKAGLLLNGYIQFSFLGGSENKAGLFDATKDENTVMFTVGQQADFERLRDAIKEKTREVRQSVAPTHAASGADELEKLASLRDRGILTEDEFQAKKRQVLGL